MLKGTVARNDALWEGHPDVAYFQDKIFVVYRESDCHLTRSSTRIRLVYKDKNLPFSNPLTIASSENRLNCPRLSVVDDTLWIVCDEVECGDFIRFENDESKTKILFWKSEDGLSWEGPIETGITGIVPDRVCPTDDGFLIATHTQHYDRDATAAPSYGLEFKKEEGKDCLGCLVQNIWHATTMDGSWSKYSLCRLKNHHLCEASVCRLRHGSYVALIRENSGLGLPAFVCHSEDGIKWSSPIQTRMFGCHRPVTGQLKSGKVLTTYRDASHSFRPGYWAKNTFACLTDHRSALSDFKSSIVLPLDHDKNTHSDSGYTGWVQLPNESIFIVNYITDDAPKPHIRWYIIRENEF